ncbi:MAG: hypothetical protein BGO49_25925 [Planctomycetales bacterium 71-10]|nr:MAG: hypothetical protein BGO49_25925 [Planctomycetales bacterium 71-10]
MDGNRKWLILPGGALALVCAIVGLQSTGRASLSAQEMASLRGANPNLVLFQDSCDQLNGITPCLRYGQFCTTCETNAFVNTRGSSTGGYNAGTGVGACGSMFYGVCTSQLVCAKGEQEGKCTIDPPNSPTVQ